jgi:hypothetical protein
MAKKDRKIGDKESLINLYFQTVLTNELLPSIDEHGCVCTALGNGKSSTKNRKNLQGSKLLQHFQKYLLQSHIHYCGPPKTRALRHVNRGDGTVHLSFNMSTRVPILPWDNNNAALAAKEFEVPEGTKIRFQRGQKL